MEMVSVIIPAYNSQLYIVGALQSVLRQTIQDLEVIVVDDGSTDDTFALVSDIAALDARVAVHRQPNSGRPSCARNAGISKARGEFICLLDADDEWHPAKLERQLKVAHEHDTAGVVFTDRQFFTVSPDVDAEEPYLRQTHYLERIGAEAMAKHSGGVYLSGDSLARQMLLGTGLVGAHSSTIMIRRAILETHDLRFREDVIVAEDTDLFIRMARVTRFAFLDEALSFHRRTPGSISRRTKDRQYAADGLATLVPLMEELEDSLSTFEKRELRDSLADAWLRLGQRAWNGGLKQEARSLFLKSAKVHPRPSAYIYFAKTSIPLPWIRAYRTWRWGTTD